MEFLSREVVNMLRGKYRKGARVVRLEMDDPQAPPIGAKGTVRHVADAAGIGVNWDNGNTLSAIYGVDRIRKIDG